MMVEAAPESMTMVEQRTESVGLQLPAQVGRGMLLSTLDTNT